MRSSRRLNMTRWIAVALVAMLSIAGCVPLAGEEIPSGKSFPKTTPATATVQPLTFEGNGDTFLAYIEEKTSASATPQQHTYLEFELADGTLWQGEALLYGDTRTIVLQQALAGSERGIELEVAAHVDLAALLDTIELPADEVLTPIHPEIRYVRARPSGDAQWTFDVTLAYPDTGWADYADGWHIATPSGEILGTHVLLHPHVNEQPFTRSLNGLSIPADVGEVVVRSHSLTRGYAPEVVTVPLTESIQSDRFEVIGR